MKEVKNVNESMKAVKEAFRKSVEWTKPVEATEGMSLEEASKARAQETAEARHQMIIEDRIASFKKYAGTYTDQDIEEFSRIPVDKMRDILRFLACGYKLEKIKTYTIWKQHQTK